MNPFERYQSEAQRQHTEAIVDRHMQRLFERLPMLSGFWLRPDFNAELAIFTWPGCAASDDLYEEVMQSLVGLAEERPEAVALLRGRTFARALH